MRSDTSASNCLSDAMFRPTSGENCVPITITPTSRKRKRSEEQSDETGDSQEISPNSTTSSESRGSVEGKIPSDISNWKEEHIQSLSIVVQYEENKTPFDLLKDYILPIEGNDYNKYLEKKKILDKFERYFLDELYFHGLLNDDFDSLSRANASALRKRTCYSTREFIEKRAEEPAPPYIGPYIAEWCHRFETAGVQFAECLYFTLIRRDLDIIDDEDNRIQPLTEYHFQCLFEAFASIFNLKSFNWNAPMLRSKILSLSQRKAAGKTDIIYYQEIGKNEEMPLCRMKNIVAICEVKKYYKEPQQLERVVTRKHESSRVSSSSSSTQSSSTQKTLPPHMSLAELGQLGGELLLYSQQSFAKGVIFGIFVQETKVSFAILKITPAEYSGILEGKFEKTSPVLIITRPFDYLKKKDRRHLIKPLLQLSMIQEQIFGEN